MSRWRHVWRETGEPVSPEEVRTTYYHFRKSYEWGMKEGIVVDPFNLIMRWRLGDQSNFTHLGGLFNDASRPN